RSKKNLVFSISFDSKPKNFPKEIILKIFRTANAYKEYNTLQKLASQDIFLPKILFFKEPYLILEKINGINLCDFINNNLKNIAKLKELEPYIYDRIIFSVKKLAGWIAQLHKQNILEHHDITKVIVLNKGDTRLKDFIINEQDDEVYGFDFEDSYEGDHLDDLAWICCALLDTNPGIFELNVPRHKIELINAFLKEYYRINKLFPFNFEYFAKKLIENLNIVIRRRNLSFGEISKEAILSNISEKI
ncbi:MAG: hypothetical protein ACTSQJ_13625, partial [Promethearchaeota archaeon]